MLAAVNERLQATFSRRTLCIRCFFAIQRDRGVNDCRLAGCPSSSYSKFTGTAAPGGWSGRDMYLRSAQMTHVVGRSPRDKRLSSARGRIELQAVRRQQGVSTSSNGYIVGVGVQGVFQRIVDLEDGGLVSTSVAIVWCREDGDNVAFLRPSTGPIRENSAKCSNNNGQNLLTSSPPSQADALEQPRLSRCCGLEKFHSVSRFVCIP